MPETLTESFCERCGTRYEFKAPTRLSPLRKTRGLVSGLRNYIMSQDALGDALGDAMRSEEEALAARQLEVFHESFNFCIDCRQYTCIKCWNDDAGRCRSCAPVAGTDDLMERMEAAFAPAPESNGHPAGGAALDESVGAEAWPSHDLVAEGGNGRVEVEWPAEELLAERAAPAVEETEAEPAAEVEPEHVTELEPEPVPEPGFGDAWLPPAEAESIAGDAWQAEAEPSGASWAMQHHDAETPWGEPEALVADAWHVEPERSSADAWDVEPEPALSTWVSEIDSEPAAAHIEPEAAERPAETAEEPVRPVLAWDDDADFALAATIEEEPGIEAVAAPEPEPEPVAEFEAEPVAEIDAAAEPVAAVEPEPVAAVEPEPEPQPVAEIEAAAEPVAEPEPTPLHREVPAISDTILRLPQTRRAAERPEEPAAAQADDAGLAARRAQLDLLGLEDPGEGAVSPERHTVLPYRSRGASVHPAEMAVASSATATGSFWDASAREVAGAASRVGVQNCGQCGLSLSASARFCRRCGTRQARSA